MDTYATKMFIEGKDIYEHLSPSDKIRFEKSHICDVKYDFDNDLVTISAICIERKQYDLDKYIELYDLEKKSCNAE